MKPMSFRPTPFFLGVMAGALYRLHIDTEKRIRRIEKKATDQDRKLETRFDGVDKAVNMVQDHIQDRDLHPSN